MTRKKTDIEQSTPETQNGLLAEGENPVAAEDATLAAEGQGDAGIPTPSGDEDSPLLLTAAETADLSADADFPGDGEKPILEDMNGSDPPQEADVGGEPVMEQSDTKAEGDGALSENGDSDGGTAAAADEGKKTRRRTTSKKKAAPEAPTDTEVPVSEEPAKPARRKRAAAKAVEDTPPAPRRPASSVLTIESRAEVETPEAREELVWHEMQNALRTKRILSGILGGIESTENHNIIAVVYYKDLRVVIPVSEMMIQLSTEPNHYGEMTERQNKILNNMLGCEVDFVVKGIDARTRSVVASRREAMLRKRRTFYLQPDLNGQCQIHEGRVVQARVIAVATKVVRVEVFGVESSILARDLSWEWIGDAHERYTVGDEILVRIRKVNLESPEKITIEADVRSVTENTVQANLKKCKVQGKYAGTVTDIHKGVVFVRLAIGVNAIAHSCYDSRMPAKQDAVSFAVTHIDSDRGVAMGIITRIIKQKI